jgi:hypothetical protein
MQESRYEGLVIINHFGPSVRQDGGNAKYEFLSHLRDNISFTSVSQRCAIWHSGTPNLIRDNSASKVNGYGLNNQSSIRGRSTDFPLRHGYV